MKHKIIGAVVWVGLAVIILPFFIDGSGIPESEQLDTSIEEPQLSFSEPLLLDSVDNLEMQAANTVTESAPLNATENTNEAIGSTNLTNAEQAVSTQTSPAQTPSTQAPKVAEKTITKAADGVIDAPTQVSEVITQGYAVQLASFKSKPNAVALKEKLIKAKYDAFFATKGEFTQVFVGPTLEKLQSQKLQKKLKKEFNLTGFVVTYNKN